MVEEKQEKKQKERKVGKVVHYYTELSVAAIELEGDLKVGDEVHFKGHTTDFTQPVDSMQIEHEKVESAKKGDAVGMKVTDHVRENDEIFVVE